MPKQITQKITQFSPTEFLVAETITKVESFLNVQQRRNDLAVQLTQLDANYPIFRQDFIDKIAREDEKLNKAPDIGVAAPISDEII